MVGSWFNQFIRTIRWFLSSPEPVALRLRRVLKLLLLIALFCGLFWVIPVQGVFQALKQVNGWMFLAGLIAAIIGEWLTAIQMKPLLSNQGIQRRISQIFNINMTVKFYLLFTPTTLVGSGIRWYRLAQPEGKVVEAFTALAFFRLFETFLTLALGFGFFLLSTPGSVNASVGWILFLILTIILIWILVTRFSVPSFRWVRDRSERFTTHPILQRGLQQIEKLLNAASAYAIMPAPDLFLSLISGAISALVGISSSVIIARSLGIEMSFSQMGWVLSIVILATQMPFTVAGGLGVREVTLVALLTIFQVNATQALAFSFLLFTRNVLMALLGGAIDLIETLQKSRLHQPGTALNKTGKM